MVRDMRIIIQIGNTIAGGDTTIDYNGNTYTRTVHNGGGAIFYTYDGGGAKTTNYRGLTYSIPQADNPVYVTQTKYSYNPSSKNTTVGNILGDSTGWLASPCVGLVLHTNAFFYMRVADSSSVSVRRLCNSEWGSDYWRLGIRPLVELKSTEIKLTGSGDGTSTSPYRIEKKMAY